MRPPPVGPTGLPNPGRPTQASLARRGASLLAPDRLAPGQLAWLDCTDRLLGLAADRSLSLFERVRFASFAARSLDEFYQVRFGAFRTPAAGDASWARRLERARARVDRLAARQDELLLEDVLPALVQRRLGVTSWDALSQADRRSLEKHFHLRIFPVLTPLLLDAAHPFPFVPSLTLNLAVVLQDGERDEASLGYVRVPASLPRFVASPSSGLSVPVEEVVAAHLEMLFPGMRVDAHQPFRVTRDTGLPLGATEPNGSSNESASERRRNSTPAVRLEVTSTVVDPAREFLVAELGLDESDVSTTRSLLDVARLWELVA